MRFDRLLRATLLLQHFRLGLSGRALIGDGANDGQKGIGLVMLVLIGVAPAGFVVNMNASGYEITRTRDAVNNVETFFQQRPELLKKATGVDQLVPSPDTNTAANGEFHCHPANTINALDRVKTMLTGVENYESLKPEQRGQLRRIMLCISDTTDKVAKLPDVSADDQRLLKKLKTDMLSTIEYAPIWIIMAVALALGIGTMIGWRRVATTIGEKIGKKGMTYAQGMSAQMTAAVNQKCIVTFVWCIIILNKIPYINLAFPHVSA